MKLLAARKFAISKHKGLKRKDCKTPYWRHLEKVVQNLQKIGVKDDSVLCAGWLHDTIEDTATDYDDIYEKFGKKCADMVASLTKDTRLAKPMREREYVIRLKRASIDAKIVKLCDVWANIADLENTSYSFEKKKRQAKEKMVYLRAILPAISKNGGRFSGLDNALEKINGLLENYGLAKINPRVPVQSTLLDP